MRVYYGAYPALEKQFLSYAAQFQPGPGRPVLVLCPSGRVAEYLRKGLAREQGCISNLFFVTFSQLLSALDKQSMQARLPLLPGDHLHDYILKKILAAPGLNRYPMSRGFVSALRSSLRDLADGLVEADVLDEYLTTTTDPVLMADEAHGKWLTEVYRQYQMQLANVPGYRSYQQYFEENLTQMAESAWLRGFAEIWIYGFYELTGRQLELFRALREHYSLTVFWPYMDLAAFQYAKKFFETNVLGSASETVALEPHFNMLAAADTLGALFNAQLSSQTPHGVHVTSAPEPEGELFYAAKEMVRLHEEQGIAFADMALTARSLEPYQTRLADILHQNLIPFKADFSFGLAAKPLGVFILNLLSLVRSGFDREDVLAVVSSAYFKQKNNWRYLIEESLAKRDFSQWVDLVRPGLPSYDPEFLPWLERVKTQLEFLEKPQSWDTLCQAAQAFLLDNLAVDSFTTEEQTLFEQVLKILESLKRYQVVCKRAGEREFLDEFLNALQAWQGHQVYDSEAGVTVADVGSLRGLGFKVVFLLGLNEKSFPQLISEDPVLKDYYRRVLRDQLGFWLNQKMERFEEERLLFFCAVAAAEKHLYLSFLRADTEGKPLVPSGYLVELARAAQVDLTGSAVRRISGQLTTRLQELDVAYLTPQELSLVLSLQGAQEECFQTVGLLSEAEQDALAAARQIAGFGMPTERDGQIGSAQAIFEEQNEKGFSPSALQDLARCPMKYFLAKGLGLKEKDEVFSRSELAPNLRGSAYHTVLMDYYEQLYKEGLTGQLFPSALQARLDNSLAKNYTAQSYKNFGIYPVIWEIILQDIHDKLSAFVLKDAEELGSYVPSIFETYFEKVYAPSQALRVKLKGIIDRIDIDSSHKTFRIVDYKSGRHGGKDLTADMFKYVILQPFIYLILAQSEPQTQGLSPDGAKLLNINKGYGKQELPQAGFEAIKPRADQFISLLMQLIKRGSFFINPGEHCAYCAYGAICRKDAFRSRARARRAPLAKHLEEAKQ